MAFKYPNGQSYQPMNKTATKNSASKLTTAASHSNRGMTLEKELNLTNQYYLERNFAVIHKKPIPIQLVKVQYPKRSAAVIKEAYFKQASTTDYNGIYRGFYLDFEAKETKNKTSFPLNNFHEHQINHLKACVSHGGICFVIIKFSLTQEVYLLPGAVLFKYWDEQATSRKSIPKKVIASQGYQIQYGINPVLPYLIAVDLLIDNLDHNK